MRGLCASSWSELRTSGACGCWCQQLEQGRGTGGCSWREWEGQQQPWHIYRVCRIALADSNPNQQKRRNRTGTPVLFVFVWGLCACRLGPGKGSAFSLCRPVRLDGCVVWVHTCSHQEWVLSLSTACSRVQGTAAALHLWDWDRKRSPGSQCPSGSATSNTDKVFLLPKPLSTINFDGFLATLVNYLLSVFTPTSLLPAALCAGDSVICDLLIALLRSLIPSLKSLPKLPYYLPVLSSLPLLFSFWRKLLMLTIQINMFIKEKKEEASLCWGFWAIPCIYNIFLAQSHYNFLWFFIIFFKFSFKFLSIP